MYQELGIFATSISFKFDPIGPKSVFRMIVEFILVCVDQPSFESSDCILYRWKRSINLSSTLIFYMDNIVKSIILGFILQHRLA